MSGEINDTYETHKVQKRAETFGLTTRKELRKSCGICDCMYQAILKDQILNGIIDSHLQEKLLQKRAPTLDKCIGACRAAESGAKQANEMSHSEVNRVHPRSSIPWSGIRPSHSGPSGPAGWRKQCVGSTEPRQKTVPFLWQAPCFPTWSLPCPQAQVKRVWQDGPCQMCQVQNSRWSVNHVVDEDEGVDVDGCLQSHIGPIPPSGVGVASSQKAAMRVQGKKKAFLIDTGARGQFNQYPWRGCQHPETGRPKRCV